MTGVETEIETSGVHHELPSTESSVSWPRMRLRVPRDDGAVLAQPALAELPRIAQQNSDLLTKARATVLDQSLAQLRSNARRELLAAAQRATDRFVANSEIKAQVRSDSLTANAAVSRSENALIFATGHQPELFHAGVWIKQLAVSRLADQHAATGLNLVVDNDTLNHTSISVPGGTREELSVNAIEFDRQRSAQPWEEARVLDRDLFESFGNRVCSAMNHWGLSPVMQTIWPHVVAHSRIDSRLGHCLTAGRVQLERRVGKGNLELPMSELCESESFRRFALHLMRNAQRLLAIYNQTVAEYRLIHRIRNVQQPVPNLLCDNDWFEVPLWIWQAGATVRERVFVKLDNEQLHLASGPSDSRRLVALGTSTKSIADDLAALQRLSDDGWRLRSRALTTTCFARLLLCDVFVHGIGGAKYDEITDRLIARFFDIPAPKFVTLSATLWLPFAEPYVTSPTDVLKLKQRQRDLQQNPQRYLGTTQAPRIAELIAEKLRLIDEQHAVDLRIKTEGRQPKRDDAGYRRYRRLREINLTLAQSTLSHQQSTQAQIAIAEHDVAANSILKNREFATWLYSEARLRELCRLV